MRNSFLTDVRILRSAMHWTTPWSVPNWESRPSVKSMRKKRIAHTLPAGNWLTASVKMMKAKPVPLAV